MLTTDSLRIPKFIRRKRSEDFAFLRERGIAYIQQMGHALWTDFNSHDPGVTLLEALCYALTELSHKAQLPIEDLLAEELPGREAPEETFFTPRRILTCNPVTALDYRMLLIDCPGVDNGWLLPVAAPEPLFHVDCEEGELTYEEKFGLRERHRGELADHRVPEGVVDKLGSLFGQTFPDEASFVDAVAGVLTAPEWDAYRSLLLGLGDRFPTLPPQGVSDIALVLEPDSVLGDLNVLRIKLTAGTGQDAFDLALYIEGRFQPWLYETPPESVDPVTLFSPVVWDDAARLYRTAMRIPSASGATVEVPVNAVSQRLRELDERSQLSTAHRVLADAALRDEGARVYAGLRARLVRTTEIVSGVLERLHAHRSLCEDFREVRIAETDDIGLCADVEVEESADIDAIAAEIRHRVQRFLAPRVVFHTFAERLAAGLSVDQIFNGPALRHGFLDPSAVEAADFRDALHTSDLIHVIMDIPGVTAVRDLQLSRFHRGETLDAGQRWCLPLSGDRALRLSDVGLRLLFYKGLIPYRHDRSKSDEKLRELTLLDRHKRLEASDYDLPVPVGKDRQVRRYHTVQNELPLTYGIGHAGLAARASTERKAQAKQLKAFLLLFDQLLADYLAQLANLKQLFSLDDALEPLRQTCFGQPLYSVPESYHVSEQALRSLGEAGVAAPVREKLRNLFELTHLPHEEFASAVRAAIGEGAYAVHGESVLEACRFVAVDQPELPRLAPLVKPFVDELDLEVIDLETSASYGPAWEAYTVRAAGEHFGAYVQGDPLRESEVTFHERRNAILDHLMARFAEAFTEYAVQIYTLEQQNTPEDLIADKVAFLRDYPRVSRDRGKAFDYRSGRVWSSENVSGFERRVARMLGLESTARRRLHACYLDPFEIFPELDDDGIDEYWFRLRDQRGDIVLTSTRHFLSFGEAYQEIERVVRFGVDARNWAVRTTVDGRFYLVLLDGPEDIPAADVLAQRKGVYFPAEEDALREIERSRAAVERAARFCEGFHLVEHILLRPRLGPGDPRVAPGAHADALLPVCTDGDCRTCIGALDPYSFRATVVVPATAGRFKDYDFRRFAEKTMREQAPAHVHLKICWVDEEDLERFEVAYGEWLVELSRELPDALSLGDKQNALLSILTQLRSVYPEVHLHDCADDGGGRPALLDHSILGSREDIDDA